MCGMTKMRGGGVVDDDGEEEDDGDVERPVASVER
jgi:hypothetical protein